MTDQISKAYNDHNVYILGAGFSAEAGLPLIRNFMNRMRDAAAWLEDQGGRDKEIRAIEQVLDFRLQAAAAAYRVPIDVENVEELFSLVSASGDRELVRAMPLAIAATLDYARNTATLPLESWGFALGTLNPLENRPPNWGSIPSKLAASLQNEQPKREWYDCPPYEFYLGLMCGYFNKGGSDRRDTIITFNYDTVVEDSLDALGIPYSYGTYIARVSDSQLVVSQGVPHALPLLKLHGSVNWCPGEDYVLPEGERAVVPREMVQGYAERAVAFPSYRSLRKSEYNPVLVPPTWQKAFRGPLLAVWSDAVTALSTATRLIIVGYSVPVTDNHFRYLLGAGLQKNISLRKVFFVNPELADEQLEKQFRERLFGKPGLLRQEHLEQRTIEFIGVDLRQFLGGQDHPESYRLWIGRPLNPPAYRYELNAPWRCYPHSGGGLIQV
jgi:SIR2-like protein